MGLRRDTEWNRTTVQKAVATMIVGPETDETAMPGACRRVRLVLRAGTIACRIMPAGVDANDEIAASRTFEWVEVDGPTDTLVLHLAPHQCLWAIVANETSFGGLVKLSVIVEYLADGGAL